MKFMCLVLHDPELSGGMTEEDWKAFSAECLAYDRRWLAAGNYITSAALENASTARTLRVRSGEAFATDGPFMETKEQIAGILLLEARDMAEAVAIATESPFARIGALEVRTVADMERFAI